MGAEETGMQIRDYAIADQPERVELTRNTRSWCGSVRY